MRFCTVVARNYLAHARVLATSLAEHHPGTRLHVLVLDDIEGTVNAGVEPFEVVRPGEIGLDDEFRHMAAIYDVMELATAVKPWLLGHLLDIGPGPVCYLDPDIMVFASLYPLEDLVAQHDIVLIPHTSTPMPRDGLTPTERDILLAGVYNLGFLALSQNTRPFLAWWAERLRRDCRVALDEAIFVDQRWIDFVPGYFDHYILTDPGYNVAYWNVYDREIKAVEAGYEVNGHQLRFFHFSGYSPLAPFRLSKHEGIRPRVRLPDHPMLARLCEHYGQQLLEAGYLDLIGKAYTFNYTALGLPLDRRMRSVYRAALSDAPSASGLTGPPDPFNATTAPAFHDWMCGPSGGQGVARVSRYLQFVYAERPDIQSYFGDLSGRGGEHFLEWIQRHGRLDAGVPPECLPAAPVPTAPERPSSGEMAEGVNVVGYLRAENGLGEVARGLLETLVQANIPHAAVQCGSSPSRQEHVGTLASMSTQNDVNIICVNADELQLLHGRMGEELPRSRYTVGIWAWEVSSFPAWMRQSASLVDEVWVYSAHAAQVISPVIDKPVYVFPPPIRLVDAPSLARSEFGLPAGFMFLFCFDYYSVFERKNPLAVVEAFSKAFLPGEGPQLVIKSVNGEAFPVDSARLRRAAEGRSDIRIMDGYESRPRQQGLMDLCDCYVSLHRAEGYGLTIAEAMALGKPTIATNYSGNLEFMNADNSKLVPHELVSIPLGMDPYPLGAYWADPDTSAAAEMMREMVADPGLAAELGERGRHDIQTRHAPSERTSFIHQRLDALREHGKRMSIPRQQRVSALLQQGPDIGTTTGFGRASRLARRLVLRGTRHYREHQRAIDETLLETTTDLGAAVVDAESQIDVLRRRIDNFERRIEGVVESFENRTEAASTRAAVAVARADEIEVRLPRLTDQIAAVGKAAEEGQFVFADLTATPYMADGALLRTTDEDYGEVIGYRDGSGEPMPLYLGFEEIFRGSEAMVKERQRPYIELLRGMDPVLELGCGRGELLELLAEAGVPATGVDLDQDMVGRVRSKGLKVEQGDALKYLAAQPDGSLGAVVSFQFVEHVEPDDLIEIMRLAARKVRPTGLFIAETVNPHSPRALKSFWVDVSHQKPLFPETIVALCRLLGYQEARAFFPFGVGDLTLDLRTQGEYAVIARPRTQS